ncbi:MAG: hypothetical protein DRI01_06660 [Chloroflexi bacterium]|nr:MAG: hypothetical protein DRI01_06660 [Chloroflexota bacterium]
MAWAKEPEPVGRIENRQEQREQEENRKVFFLGKKEITPRSDVVLFENEEFFIEKVDGSFIIRPRYIREYLRIRGKRNKKYMKFTRAPTPIMIPLITVRENPMLWFEQNYLINARRNMQGHFIRKIWEHRYEFMPMLCMG